MVTILKYYPPLKILANVVIHLKIWNKLIDSIIVTILLEVNNISVVILQNYAYSENWSVNIVEKYDITG